MLARMDTPPQQQQRPRAASLRPVWVALGLWLALALVAAAALWHLRREALDGQARELGLVSLSLTNEIDRGLQGAEAGLKALQGELREGLLPLAGAPAERALRTRADLMPLVETLWLVQADGRVTAASDTTPPPALATFEPALQGLAGDGVALSRPFGASSAGQASQPMVALAVRFDGPSGQPGGWIFAAMPTPTLLGAFAGGVPAADARMAVFRSDGVRLAAANADAPAIADAEMARQLTGRPGLALRRFRDGSEHLVGLHPVPRYGLHVVVSRSLTAALASWRGAAELSAASLALLLAIVLASAWVVRRADRRHGEAQRALQAQLARASKLEALGTLAGVVAHDFNNVLAGIVGFGEMAQDAAPQGSDQARHLDKVLQAALRGKALAERILAFSRGGARASTVFELEPVIEEVLALLSASLRPGLLLERGLQAPGARLRGDPTQAFEAVMNLCTNALQAMPAGGRLSVQLERVAVTDARVLSHSLLVPGRHLALTVADQGGGITPEVMERLFEPFFTTRGAERGTGLGLAVVHGVVAEFGGAIDVASTPGQGARFTLYFPECTDATAEAASLPGHAVPRGQGQALLVVDDEPTLVALAEEILTGLGYGPVGFTDPQAALQALRENPGRFAAVITDEVMPGLTGTQLTEALRAHAPGLPVLLVSGYGGALLARRATAAGVTRVMSKPLRRAELARALAELLR
jgi:signal transduction histidine kinase